MQTTGLIDLQVNGYAGVDFNDAALDATALDHALHAMMCAGVTACLPTLITAPEAVLANRFAALDRAVANSRLGPLMVPGFHLEGPFLNPAPGFAGCHPPGAMLPPDPALLLRLAAPLTRPILLLTLAPEQSGGMALIAWATQRGMLVAIGHSAADQATVAEAAGAGTRLSTHLGNALPHMQPKFRNPLIAQLAEDRLSASFIADGIHIPPAALKVLLRAKGLSRTVLVTDATAAAATAARALSLRRHVHRACHRWLGPRARQRRAGRVGAVSGPGGAQPGCLGPCGAGRGDPAGVRQSGRAAGPVAGGARHQPAGRLGNLVAGADAAPGADRRR